MKMLLIGLISLQNIFGSEFISPTRQHVAEITLEQIKYDLKGKGVGLGYRELFDKAIAQENSGFMGYHGDSLDFLVYQDVIRVLVEEVLKIPVRKDFHFISTPFRGSDSIQSLEDLSELFIKDVYYSEVLIESTFPLNFSLYANHNRLGLNSVLNFTKNVGESANLHRKELQHMFEELGIDLSQLDTIDEISRQHLDNKAGVLLQVFDSSATPYEFGNTVGYGGYPNGFIAENHLVSDYFLESRSEFPQELRLVLDVRGVLNPTSPLIIKRYTKIQPGNIKAWEQDLRELLKNASFDPIKRDAFHKNLANKWSK